MVEFYDDGHLELYNLKEDIGEELNLAGEMPEKAKELQQALSEWRSSIDAGMPVANSAFDL